jgi:hypothetical protein
MGLRRRNCGKLTDTPCIFHGSQLGAVSRMAEVRKLSQSWPIAA